MSGTTDAYAANGWAIEAASAAAHGQRARRPWRRGGPALERAVLWALDGAGARRARVAFDAADAALAALVVAPAHGHGPRAWLVAFPPLAVALLAAKGLYRPRRSPSAFDDLAGAAAATAIAALLAAIAGLAGGAPPDTARVALLWLAGTLAIALPRAALASAQRSARAVGAAGAPALIVGSGEVARAVTHRLQSEPAYGLRPVGFIDDDPHPAMPPAPLPLLGGTDDLPLAVAATGARHVLLAFAAEPDAKLAARVRRDAARLRLTVGIVPRLFEAMSATTTYEPLGETPVLWLHRHDAAVRAKHALDRGAAALLLVALAPLLALIAVAVKLSSPGPVLFRQRRLGRAGEPFELLKFRSMRIAATPTAWRPADGSGPGGVEGEDRRTRVGLLLRRTSLDELPQLLNVLRGEMSIVGPRPERPEVAELLAADLHRYAERQRMKPGITGWAQIHGLRGSTTSLADRIAWDNFYVEHWSPALDLKILARTLRALVHSSE